MDRLHLNAEDITIQPVHPSIIGQDTWFQITYTSSGTTRYFSCQNSRERDEWISSLKKTLMLTEDRRRTDNSLRLAVVEVKGLRDKKKYYCEVHVDQQLYARTASKKMSGGMCFWGEQFDFSDLPRAESISLLIHKDKGGSGSGGAGRRSKKAKKPVGRVRISVASVTSRYMQEKWHPVEKSSRRECPSVRLKCQYQSVDILPLREYEEFLYYLKDDYKQLCKCFEPHISVKVKEELSHGLMSVFHAEDIAEDVLAEIVVDEISSVENEHLTFRGNSIATKAMEAYIKLVGNKYLQGTLQTVVNEIIQADVDLEVDPVKVGGSTDVLAAHRTNLLTVVRSVWSRIAKSHSSFPSALQRCFSKIRQYLEFAGKPEVGDNLISSCIFLRYLCPAIMGPTLFNLTDEFPGERANRNLTLVAKTIQTLANFTRYEGKENSMEFLNAFLEEESVSMSRFLRQISSPLADDGWIPQLLDTAPPEKTDLGRNLSCLHTVLYENVSKVSQQEADNASMAKLRQILDDISRLMRQPTIPTLEQISQSTMTTLEQKRRQQQQQQQSTTTASTTSKGFSWTSWTLPKKNSSKSVVLGTNNASASAAASSLSHPAPHHVIDGRSVVGAGVGGRQATFANPEPGISLSSDTSSSSTSPSPGTQIKIHHHHRSANLWPATGASSTKSTSSSSSSASSAILGTRGHHQHATDLPSRKPNHFQSNMSLDDTDSSDDSTYSSQYQSDANSTPRQSGGGAGSSASGGGGSSTLPRPLTGGGHGYSSRNRHAAVQRGNNASSIAVNASPPSSKVLSDYEREIQELRSAMEVLKVKLGDAESRLKRESNGRGESEVRVIVNRLVDEEDRLRRAEQQAANASNSSAATELSDKERMILMQQKKIAALDEANNRLVKELTRLGEKLEKTTPAKNGGDGAGDGLEGEVNEDGTPKTVEELIDSLHSTPI